MSKDGKLILDQMKERIHAQIGAPPVDMPARIYLKMIMDYNISHDQVHLNNNLANINTIPEKLLAVGLIEYLLKPWLDTINVDVVRFL